MRARGSDVGAGELALRAGTVLGPPQIGLLAAIGRGTVAGPAAAARRRALHRQRAGPAGRGAGARPDPRLQLLHRSPPPPARPGAIAYRVGAVADDAETLRDTIEDQLIRADLVVTTGGVSVGAYDVVKEVLSSVGDEDEPGSGVDFRKLAMQPGKPQGFGSIGPDRTPILTLPGNPVSSYVSFEVFVRPVIRTLMGAADGPPRHRAGGAAPDRRSTSPDGQAAVPARARTTAGRAGHGHPGRRRRLAPGRGPRARQRADRRPRGRHRGRARAARSTSILLG